MQKLETPRLIIRIDTLADYIGMFQTGSDEELKTYFGIRGDEELETQKGKVEGGLSTYRTSVMFFHLIQRSANIVIGSFAFHNWYPAHRRAEVGYAMSPDAYRNKGYMREAFPAIIAFGFSVLNLNRMEAFIAPQNTPSIKLVERIGFRQEGCLRSHYFDEGVMGDSLVYGLLREDYEKLSPVS